MQTLSQQYNQYYKTVHTSLLSLSDVRFPLGGGVITLLASSYAWGQRIAASASRRFASAAAWLADGGGGAGLAPFGCGLSYDVCRLIWLKWRHNHKFLQAQKSNRQQSLYCSIIDWNDTTCLSCYLVFLLECALILGNYQQNWSMEISWIVGL